MKKKGESYAKSEEVGKGGRRGGLTKNRTSTHYRRRPAERPGGRRRRGSGITLGHGKKRAAEILERSERWLHRKGGKLSAGQECSLEKRKVRASRTSAGSQPIKA